MLADIVLQLAKLKGVSKELRAAKISLLDRAAVLLRRHCPNGDGGPEDSEQTAQWKACGSCEECRIADALECVAEGL